VDGSTYVFDEVGSRRETPLLFIVAEWVSDRPLTFQLWLRQDTDVTVTVDPGGLCVAFGLEGLLRQEAERVVAALVLCACIVDDTRALVVDRHLPDDGDAWRRYSRSNAVALPRVPDLLLDAGKRIQIGRESWLRDPRGRATGDET